jgi:hypothetical protein
MAIISERRSDMQKILMILAFLVFFYYSANAGLFGDDVDLADLSQLSPDALETLKDTEFNVFLTKAKHVGAKVLENKAGENLKTAKLTLDSKNLHLKSAEADLKEAKATQDQGQIEAADKSLSIAKEDYERAKMLIKWKQKEYQKALSTEIKEIAEAKKLKAEYEKMSKQ